MSPAASTLDPTGRLRLAAELMTRFAERTGVDGQAPPRRYLWTDAFAVCNFLGLARATGDPSHETRARALIEGVHGTLGRHRPDDSRAGWLGGLAETEARAHPTRGGLRIGKPMPERRPGEAFDEDLEWERDGQYFHYLTKWMHALDQTARAMGEPAFHAWARELMQTAHARFLAVSGGRPRLFWKMSVDLSRPLVPTMGQHDPLDGFVTCLELRATAAAMGDEAALDQQTREFRSMTDPRGLTTADPLGLGGLLADACRLMRLARMGEESDERLAAAILQSAEEGLTHYLRASGLSLPARRRLAFRELGLAIGLHAVDLMRAGAPNPHAAMLERLSRHARLRRSIEDFWCEPTSQAAPTWLEHQDINEVMLATSLAPEGYLVLAEVRGPRPRSPNESRG